MLTRLAKITVLLFVILKTLYLVPTVDLGDALLFLAVLVLTYFLYWVWFCPLNRIRGVEKSNVILYA